MKKNGFTLAEVLITLGVVGVIAALTLPGLNNNINKSKVGPTLAKAINTLETANKMALLENDVVSLDSIPSETTSYLDKISMHLSGHFAVENGRKNVYKYVTKDGISYEVYTNTRTAPTGTNNGINTIPDNKYRYKKYVVTIDLNGPKKKDSEDKPGVDLFFVYVDTGGAVIAAGSKEAERYFAGSEYQGEKGTQHMEKDCKQPGITIDKYCTGTIIKDGWEMKY